MAKPVSHSHGCIILLYKFPFSPQMAAITPRASGLWQDSAMTYSRLSTHDAGDDLDDADTGEIDSRTPLDRTIDQIGMGEFSFPSNPGDEILTWPLPRPPLRYLSMGPPLLVWFRCVKVAPCSSEQSPSFFFLTSRLVGR